MESQFTDELWRDFQQRIDVIFTTGYGLPHSLQIQTVSIIDEHLTKWKQKLDLELKCNLYIRGGVVGVAKAEPIECLPESCLLIERDDNIEKTDIKSDLSDVHALFESDEIHNLKNNKGRKAKPITKKSPKRINVSREICSTEKQDSSKSRSADDHNNTININGRAHSRKYGNTGTPGNSTTLEGHACLRKRKSKEVKHSDFPTASSDEDNNLDDGQLIDNEQTSYASSSFNTLSTHELTNPSDTGDIKVDTPLKKSTKRRKVSTGKVSRKVSSNNKVVGKRNVTPIVLPCEKASMKCSICDKGFLSVSGISLHKKIHNPTEACPHCEHMAPNQSSLKKHIDLVHFRHDASRKTHVCDQCGARFYKNYTLQCHISSHIRDKQYPCPHCEHTTHSRALIGTHIKNKHSNKDPYVCNICGATTKFKASMDEHLRRHFNEKPFKCTECSHCAASATNMARHKMIHKERGYECEVCQKKFVYNGQLKRHRVIHTGEKECACSECSYVCNVPSNLRKHMLNVHKVKLTRARKIVRVNDIGIGGNVNRAMPTQLPVSDASNVHVQEVVVAHSDEDQLQISEDQTASIVILQMADDDDTELQPPYTYNLVQIPEVGQCVSISDETTCDASNSIYL